MEKIKRKDGFRYREQVYFDGKALKGPYFRKITDARTWKRTTLRERDRLKSIGINQYDNRTFQEYAEYWLTKKSDKEPKTIEGYRSILNCHLLPEFGKIKLVSLRLSQAELFKTRLIDDKKLSRVRINHIIKVLKMILNDSVKTGSVIRSPFINLDYLKVQTKPKVYWLPNEISKFLTANHDDHYYPLYCFMLNTGVRPSEARGLMWDKVDFNRGIVEISRSFGSFGLRESTKSKKSRDIPMNDIVIKILKELKSRSNGLDFVFTCPIGDSISNHFGDREFPRAIKRAGVRSIQFRNLRTSYACNFVMNGGDIFTLSKILGHYSVQITEQRYADLHPDFLKREAEIVQFEAGTIIPSLKLQSLN